MNKLSVREIEVIDLVAQGLTNNQIAEHLFVSLHTVKCHIRRIMNRLDLDNRVCLARYAILNEVAGQGNKDVMIIATHPDDEVLGCFSFLKGAKVVYVTTYHPLFPAGDNVDELHKLVANIGCKPMFLRQYSMNTNNLEGISELIGDFEGAINIEKPDTVLLPNPSYNQDHRIVYDAGLTAMRHHDRNHFVKRILLYESPETWDTLRRPEPFKANYFRSLNIDAKLGAIEVYSSQLRGHRSLDYIKSISKVRGQQSNMDYAEAFEIVRWCEC